MSIVETKANFTTGHATSTTFQEWRVLVLYVAVLLVYFLLPCYLLSFLSLQLSFKVLLLILFHVDYPWLLHEKTVALDEISLLPRKVVTRLQVVNLWRSHWRNSNHRQKPRFSHPSGFMAYASYVIANLKKIQVYGVYLQNHNLRTNRGWPLLLASCVDWFNSFVLKNWAEVN